MWKEGNHYFYKDTDFGIISVRKDFKKFFIGTIDHTSGTDMNYFKDSIRREGSIKMRNKK